MKKYIFILLCIFAGTLRVHAQTSGAVSAQTGSKKISPDLFGIFFEDLSYSADGGLYAELVQNRSFEYSPADKKEWNPLTSWEYINIGGAYGSVSVETVLPINKNNTHYIVLNVQEKGKEGLGLANPGFDGISLKVGEKYDFSVFIRLISPSSIPMHIELRGKKGKVYGAADLITQTGGWKKYAVTITSNADADSASLVVLAREKGKIAIDEVSLFPRNTFKNQPNGLRADLAQAIADLHPRFMRFPGGCLAHGDGIANIYRWKNTIGPVEQRNEDRNIWHYHQTMGLGYYEYFRFCEDIGAKPLPVLAAGVSCQNSGASRGSGQKLIPMAKMDSYVQDVLDLVEYANGPVTSKWGAKRASAGHPASFKLQYIGIGNEDKITDGFRERFSLIYNILKTKHPEIIVVGTAGPSPAGEDYDLGWQFADKMNVPVIDEHMYDNPDWFVKNNTRYDSYDRAKSKVYIGEYASRGNSWLNALSEASFLTALERNGDIVQMASYAPLMANTKHISWNPNLIYFDNKTVAPTTNYYVQQLFMTNSGDHYINNIVSFSIEQNSKAPVATASCVTDSKTGDVIIKIVNSGASPVTAKADLSTFSALDPYARLSFITGDPGDQNKIGQTVKIIPVTGKLDVGNLSAYQVAPYSLSVIRIKKRNSY